jgi:hypothetical protein
MHLESHRRKVQDLDPYYNVTDPEHWTFVEGLYVDLTPHWVRTDVWRTSPLSFSL